MYFITEPGVLSTLFRKYFEIPEKERLFIHFSFIFMHQPCSARVWAIRRPVGVVGKTALTGLPEVGGEQAAHAAHGRR